MKTLSIGKLAKQFGLSTQAIRYYEKLGIIESPKRSDKGYRIYDFAAVQRIKLIQYAQGFGLSLNQIKELVVTNEDTGIMLQIMVENRVRDLQNQLQQIEQSYQELSKKREQLQQLIPQTETSLLQEGDRFLLDLFTRIESNLALSQENATLNKANDLLQRYNAGERNFQAIELIGAELNGAYLCDADFSYGEMMLAALNEVSLANCKLHRAYLSGADLVGAYLQEAELIGTELIGADLKDADLKGANLERANLGGANLTNANLTGANLSEAILIGANLTNTDFTDAIVLGCNFAETIMV